MSNLTLAERVGLLVSHLRNAGSVVWKWEASLRGAQLGRGVVFAGRPIISVAARSTLSLREGVHLVSAVRGNPLGCFQPCVLRTMSPEAILELGPGVGLSAAAVVAGREIRIGEGTILGAGAMVVDNDFHVQEGEFSWGFSTTQNAAPIHIGRGCFIGARAIILKGVTLGDRAIVGAGAVVTKDVPAGARAVGNPARNL